MSGTYNCALQCELIIAIVIDRIASTVSSVGGKRGRRLGKHIYDINSYVEDDIKHSNHLSLFTHNFHISLTLVCDTMNNKHLFHIFYQHNRHQKPCYDYVQCTLDTKPSRHCLCSEGADARKANRCYSCHTRNMRGVDAWFFFPMKVAIVKFKQ